MMRLLNDKAGRVYQRVGSEGETLKEEPQEEGVSFTLNPKQGPENPEHAWKSVSHSQHDTRLKTQKILDQGKNRGGFHSRTMDFRVKLDHSKQVYYSNE